MGQSKGQQEDEASGGPGGGKAKGDAFADARGTAGHERLAPLEQLRERGFFSFSKI